jgi:hypothetical protein
VAKSVNKCDHMLFKMKKCVFCVTMDHPMTTWILCLCGLLYYLVTQRIKQTVTKIVNKCDYMHLLVIFKKSIYIKTNSNIYQNKFKYNKIGMYITEPNIKLDILLYTKES